MTRGMPSGIVLQFPVSAKSVGVHRHRNVLQGDRSEIRIPEQQDRL